VDCGIGRELLEQLRQQRAQATQKKAGGALSSEREKKYQRQLADMEVGWRNKHSNVWELMRTPSGG